MKARAPDDRMAFYLSIERVAPQVWKDLSELARAKRAEGVPVSRADVVAFLERWGLDPACRWLVDDVLVETRSEPVGVPATGETVPTHGTPLCLSWEPGDTGETRAEFNKRAQTVLREYIEHVEAWMRECHVELPVSQRSRGEAPDGIHRWDMLASRLVLRESYQKIGDDLGISPQGAKGHVEALADRLGIAL